MYLWQGREVQGLPLRSIYDLKSMSKALGGRSANVIDEAGNMSSGFWEAQIIECTLNSSLAL